ncbi:MAG: hypothetical protein JXR80_05795 [Deltaproteobacteria bacterium]|nr:hypothetical protein [Deltaproteobacteria bacterium]
MKKAGLALLTTGLLLMVGFAVQASGSGAEKIDLKAKYQIEGKKDAVVFQHHQHQEKLACTKCHPTTAGGPLSVTIVNKTGMGNDFHQKLCWPCHIEMKVPKGKMCSTCHK